MILNGFNSDEYIYLEITRDFEDFKAGEILRYKVNDLREDSFHLALSCYRSNIELVPKDPSKIGKYAIMPFEIYDKVIVNYQALSFKIHINPNDLVIVDETFQKLISSKRVMGMLRQSVEEMNKSQISSLKQSEILFERSLEGKSSIQEFPVISSKESIANREDFIAKYHILKILNPQKCLNLNIDIDKGYEFDLSNPATALLFCNQFYLRLFANSRMLSEEEKAKYFKLEFAHCQTDKDDNTETRYFVLNENIKVRNAADFANAENYPPGIDASYFSNCVTKGIIGYNKLDEYDYDSDGFIRYVYVKDCRSVEEKLLQIARRATTEETIDHFNHYKEQKKLEYEAYKYCTYHKSAFKKMCKENPGLTPIEFMLMQEQRLYIQKQELVKKLVRVLNRRIKI